LAIINIKTCL